MRGSAPDVQETARDRGGAARESVSADTISTTGLRIRGASEMFDEVDTQYNTTKRLRIESTPDTAEPLAGDTLERYQEADVQPSPVVVSAATAGTRGVSVGSLSDPTHSRVAGERSGGDHETGRLRCLHR